MPKGLLLTRRPMKPEPRPNGSVAAADQSQPGNTLNLVKHLTP